MSYKNIKKVLIANRGGIVNRINFTCKALGLKTVAIFSPQDATSPYIYNTNQAYQINKDGYLAYLDQDEIISIAIKSGSDAIHPGFGFLSENYEFAKKVIDSGLTWIGPSPETIKLMGDKNQARSCANLAGVPTIPGTEIDVLADIENALSDILKVGFPLILKDPLGGGGKAARKVNSADELENSLHLTVSEAQKLTGTTKILVEKYLVNTRHVEIQIAGDGHNIIHLFERDCSLQRRYQKIVEEAPCKFVSKNTLEKMYAAAVRLAQSVNYKNVGTLEFMVTPEEEFFFLEMNTRLQVEHSVTEMTTGVDLVALQIYIAENNALPITQKELNQNGHAIECRIYSEDPENNFSPCTGKIQSLQLPNGPTIRIDHDLALNKEITPFFDPMQAQLTVYGQSRDSATAYLEQALKHFYVNGVTTNISFLANLIKIEDFKNGSFHTQFLSQKQAKKICDLSLLHNSETQSGLTVEELGIIGAIIIQKLKKEQTNKSNKPSAVTNNWRAQQWK